MSLFEKLGNKTMSQLNTLSKKRQLVAIHHEPQGARIVLVTGETVLLKGLGKDETARLFMSLGFKGRGKGGFDTPAFASHLTRLAKS